MATTKTKKSTSKKAKKEIKNKKSKPSIKVKSASKKASSKTKKSPVKKAAKTQSSQKKAALSPSKKNQTSLQKAKKAATKPKKSLQKRTRSATNTKVSKAPLRTNSKSNSLAKKSTNFSAKPKGTAWLQPLDDRLLIEIIDEPKQTSGGLILVDTTEQNENLQGFVIKVGRGHQNKKGRVRPIEAKAGDRVIFSKYAGDKVTHDGIKFVILRETEVLGFAAHKQS